MSSSVFESMSDQYVHWFRNSAPYINAHRGKTFVLLFGGEAVSHENFRNIVHDIALLHSLGIKLVLVHGARPQIDENLQEYGLSTPYVSGIRVTTREALRCVMDAVGAIRLEIEALLSMGLANSPMYGARIDAVSGNFITAKPYGVRNGTDFCLTGEVRSVDVEAINKNLDNRHIVILGPTGYSSTGEIYNLLAEDVGVSVASALKADKLICLGEREGIIDDEENRLLREMIPNDVDRYLRNRPLDNELLRHMSAARTACRDGVKRVHIISYVRDGAMLQELFTRDGSGTLITHDPYEEIRTADIDDVGGILELIEPLEEEGILVRRSREKLENEIEQFAVVERDGMIVGCAALYPLPTAEGEDPAGEIACVAIHSNYRKGDRGTELMNFLEKRALSRGLRKLFVLTTRTGLWFEEHGFARASVDDLPKHRQSLYNFQRNSLVLSKTL